MVSLAVCRGLGANLGQLIHRSQLVVTDRQMGQIGKVLGSIEVFERVVAQEELLDLGKLESQRTLLSWSQALPLR